MDQSEAQPTPYLSLIVPAYNEAARLPASLRRIVEFCNKLPFSFEVIVVVEKSTDGTLALARSEVGALPGFQVIDNEIQRGKGYAVRSGMLKARGEYLFFTDADLGIPLSEIPFFIEYFRAHPDVDVLIGNRGHAQSQMLKRQSTLRKKMGRVFNTLIQSFTQMEIHDTQCGFKGFRNTAAKGIFSRQKLDGFAFDVELLLIAERLGYEVVDLPVQLANSEASSVHIVRDSLKMLGDVIRVKRMVDKTFAEYAASRSNAGLGNGKKKRGTVFQDFLFPAFLLLSLIAIDRFFFAEILLAPLACLCALILFSLYMSERVMAFWTCLYMATAVYVLTHPAMFLQDPSCNQASILIRCVQEIIAGGLAFVLCAVRSRVENNHDQFFNLIKRIPQALILSDGEGRVRFLNKQAEKLLCMRNEEAQGTRYFDLIHDISEKGVSMKQYSSLLESGRTSEMHIKFKPPSRSNIILSGKMIPVHSANLKWLITAVYENQPMPV